MLVKTVVRLSNVGCSGSRRAPLASPFGLNAPRTIQRIGKSWTNARRLAMLTRIQRLTRATRRAVDPARTTAVRCEASTVADIEAASLGELERDTREQHQHDRVPRRHRRGVTELARLERLLVDVVDAQARRV